MSDELAKPSIRNIPTKLLVINPKNPRKIFDQEKLDILYESIKERGILVPLNVFLNEDKKFTIIDGERRYKIALQLGLKELPAIINNKPSSDDYVQDMFHIHNLREPWELIPTAIKLKELIDIFKRKNNQDPTEKELQKLTGLTISEIRRCRIVLSFPDKIQDIMLQEEARTSKEKSKIGKDKILTEDLFIEIAKNMINPLKENNLKIYNEIGKEAGIFEAIIDKRRRGLIKNTAAFRPIAKYLRDKPIHGGKAIKDFILKQDQSSEHLLVNVGLVFDPYKFERNMNIFYGAIRNIPSDLQEAQINKIKKILLRVRQYIDVKLKEL